jgi:hypothetical protein
MADSATRCPQCGEAVSPPTGSATPPTRCDHCGAALPPTLAIESWFTEPEPPKPEPAAEVLDLEILDEPAALPVPPREPVPEPLPDTALDADVPTVQPAPRAARRVPPSPVPTPTPISSFRPRGLEDESERPRPQIGLAIFALLVMFLLMVAGLTVLLYMLWTGLKSLPRPRKADAPPARVVPCESGAARVA